MDHWDWVCGIFYHPVYPMYAHWFMGCDWDSSAVPTNSLRAHILLVFWVRWFVRSVFLFLLSFFDVKRPYNYYCTKTFYTTTKPPLHLYNPSTLKTYKREVVLRICKSICAQKQNASLALHCNKPQTSFSAHSAERRQCDDQPSRCVTRWESHLKTTRMQSYRIKI